MDRKNLANLQQLQPRHFSGHLRLFLPFGQGSVDEVPDPYAGGEEGFEQVLDMVEQAAEGLLAHLRDGPLSEPPLSE